MQSYVGTPEYQMRDLTSSLDSSSLRQIVSDKLEAKRAQRTWAELTSAISTVQLLQDSAQARLDLLSKQERDISRATLAEAQKAWPGMSLRSKEYAEDINRAALLARESRVNLQRNIRAESDLVAAYAEQVGRLQSLLEDNMSRYKGAQYLLSQKGVPVEIWRRIFYLSIVHDKGHQSLSISHVCRFWRMVAVAYPELWARIPVETKSTRLALVEMERFLERTKTSHCLHLSFKPSPLRFRLSAHDVEISTPLIRSEPHNVNGQDVAYDMHDLTHIDSLEIEGSNNSSTPRIFLTSWGIRYLHCREILPVLSPSVADHITKLTLNYRKWPDSFRLEQFLRLLFGLEELNINCRHNSGIRTMPNDYVMLPKLRCLRTTVDILLHNITALTQSPYLRRLGIYPTESTPPVFSGLWNQIDEKMPRLRQSISHFEIHTLTESTFQFQFGCSSYLALFRGIQTLELRGPSCNEMLNLVTMYLNGEIDGMGRVCIDGITELVLRKCRIVPGVLIGLVTRKKWNGRWIEPMMIKKITLDCCTGLKRADCEEIKRNVEILEIFG